MDTDDRISIRLKVFCFPVTLRCNLKCKLCGAHSPYYKNPYHPTIDSLCSQLDAFFQIVSHVDKFDIGGGEPFLRTDLASVMAYLRSGYHERISHLRIITNGTLLPSDDRKNNLSFVEEALKWGDGFSILIDKYAVKQNKSEEIDAFLKNAGVIHEVRDYVNDLHCGGWVDFDDLSCKRDEDATKRLFLKCAVPRQGFFTSVVDGKIFPCGRARILYERGLGKDFVDMMDSHISTAMKQQHLFSMLHSNYLDACRYCNGMCDDSNRYIPAEQLSED